METVGTLVHVARQALLIRPDRMDSHTAAFRIENALDYSISTLQVEADERLAVLHSDCMTLRIGGLYDLTSKRLWIDPYGAYVFIDRGDMKSAELRKQLAWLRLHFKSDDKISALMTENQQSLQINPASSNSFTQDALIDDLNLWSQTVLQRARQHLQNASCATFAFGKSTPFTLKSNAA